MTKARCPPRRDAPRRPPRARAGTCGEEEPACGVRCAEPQSAFRRESRVQKVSARECARARVRGRGSERQQPTRRLHQKLRSSSRAGKCDSPEPGGEVEGEEGWAGFVTV